MSETETVRKSARGLGFDPELVLPALNFWLERARAADRLGVDGETFLADSVIAIALQVVSLREPPGTATDVRDWLASLPERVGFSDDAVSVWARALAEHAARARREYETAPRH